MDWLLDRLLPRHCLVCGGPSGPANLCPDCDRELPRTGACCLHCALPLPGHGDAVCGACLAQPPPWNEAVAALEYRYPARQLARRFKFNRCLASGEVLALELARSLRRRGGAPPDAVVPVPLHFTRFFVRGYNQAELIACRVARELGVPVAGALLRRRRRTAAQSMLDAAGRRRNVRGAFEVVSRRRGRLPRRVALVDDVMTTGATLDAATRALHRAGVREVVLWVAARAPPP